MLPVHLTQPLVRAALHPDLAILAPSAADAATVPPATDLAPLAMQYGLAGAVALSVGPVMLWFAKRLMSQADERVAAAETRADRMETRNEELNRQLVDRIIPALTTAAAAMERIERDSRNR